jgi:hypothetical protein
VETFVPAIAHFCRQLKVLELNLSRPFENNLYTLHAWNRLYQDEPDGKLYQSKRILDKTVATHLCKYIAQLEDGDSEESLPEQCRVILKINVKMDNQVSSVCNLIGGYCRHIQSLTIDRTKFISLIGNSFMAAHLGANNALSWPHLQVSYSSPSMHSCS